MIYATINLQRWVCKDFEYQTLIGDKPVIVTAPKSFLIQLEHEGRSITVSARELRKALDAMAVTVSE